MNREANSVVIAKFGDAADKLLELLDQANKLASKVAPNAPESDNFFDIIGQIRKYLELYGFQLKIIVITEEKGCVLRLAICDTAPTQIKQ